MTAQTLADCGVAPPESLLSRHAAVGSGGNGNAAEFLTDLVVGADRENRSQEYVRAYAKSSMRARMQAITEEGSRVCPQTPPNVPFLSFEQLHIDDVIGIVPDSVDPLLLLFCIGIIGDVALQPQQGVVAATECITDRI